MKLGADRKKLYFLGALILIGGAIAILGVVIVNSLGRPTANERLAGKVGPSL